MTTPRLFDRPAAATSAPSTSMDAFAERYRQFFPRVFAYVFGRVHNSHLAEDLVADVFERAFLKAGSLRNDEAFSTWLFTIARNVIISHSRKHHREAVVDPEVMREELDTVATLLRDFPQREQDILALKFDAELSNTQIANIMELSEANVRVILFRTLRRLREQMLARRKG